MRLMTAGLVIKRRELLEEAERCCQELANHTIVEKHDGANWSSFMEWLERIQPQVLLIDVEHFQGAAEERVRQIKAASPQSMLIALHHKADSQMILAGMRAGIDEYFYPPLAKNLHQVLERRIDLHVRDQFLTTSDRKTIAFLSAKGGCGGTTVACHAALELGKRMHQTGKYHVLLADLDWTGGDVRFLMRSKAPHSVLDAMQDDQGLSLASWNLLVSGNYPGLEVIAGPAELRLERMPEQREIERLLNFARSRYQWTVLDLGSGLTLPTMSILESVNELYLVASADVLGLYQVKQIMHELERREYKMERLHLILNQCAEYTDRVIADEAQHMLGTASFYSFPNDGSGLAEAHASGSLLAPDSPLLKQISALATEISGIEDQDQLHGRGKEPWYRKLRVSRGVSYELQHQTTTT
ncbi:MAG: AAA family ATPase [Acidobacteriia bacterium]|nr:AAA family ATPase [Terriglobia bacterium]